MKKLYTIITLISVLIIIRSVSKILYDDTPIQTVTHEVSDILESESAYDIMPLVCNKSYQNVSKIYPDILSNKVDIYVYDGDFSTKYGHESLGYFYSDSLMPLIVINKNKVIGSDIELTLTHELLHYVDFLKGRNKLWSDNLDLNIIDEKISDKDYFIKKVFYTHLVDVDKIDSDIKEKDSYKEMMESVEKEYENNIYMKPYYNSTSELFVRVNLLKLKMYEYEIITEDDLKTFKGGLSEENIIEFLKYIKGMTIDDSYYNIIYLIKWDWGNEN